MAISVPILTDITQTTKLNDAVRERRAGAPERAAARREPQSPLRVRLNCPANGYLRTVEVIGTTEDNATNRCLLSAYPFPAADTDLMTKPNYDGPMQTLPTGATVTSAVFEFEPDGTANMVVSGTAQSIHVGDDHGHAQRQIQVGDGQWRRQNPAPVSRGFSLIEVVVAMGLLTVVSLGVAQLFAASTRVNIIARSQTSTTMLAEQKMEQIRSLTWGFDTDGRASRSRIRPLT